MKKFIIQTIVFVLICILSFLFFLEISSYILKNRGFKNHETFSNTLVFKKNQHFDIMFSGISHARNMSRYGNHHKVETILGKSLINIGQGAGACDVNEQFFYLKYFLSLNNSVDKLVYILSPPALFSSKLPVASNTFNNETFSSRFLLQYIFFESENKRQRIAHYLKSKLSFDWMSTRPITENIMLDSLTEIDTLALNNGFTLAYGDSLNFLQFERSCKIIEKEIVFAISNNIGFIVIIPPAAFGHWPGHDNVDDFAKNMQKKYDIGYVDFSKSIPNLKYYYDHHHLNTKGVVYFTEQFLKDSIE